MERSLECLSSCMKFYPGPCGQVRAVLERRLLDLVDWPGLQPCTPVQQLWASCVALLPGLGSGGPQGIQYKANWVQMCNQLTQSTHRSVAGLFANIDEVESYQVESASFEALKLSDLKEPNAIVQLHAEKHRTVNLCAALAQFLK